ncbi:MAG: choline-sulfatase [Myxococcota bacterium]|jgi:choline-sulfatase
MRQSLDPLTALRGCAPAGRRRGGRWAAGLLVGVALLASSCTCSRPPVDGPPNVVLIVVDTLRADHLGLYGYERATSPALDAWADDAMVFDRAYSHAPWTKPSIASLLTSRLPRDHGVHDWDHALDPDLDTLQGALKTAGYRTEAYVSHHALDPKWNNFHHGFDVYDTSAYEGRGSPHHISSSARVANATIEALDRLQWEPPFFLWAHFFDPHDTYLDHPKHDFGDADIDRYDSEIAFTDRNIGRILDHLEATGLSHRTVVAFTADHGEGFGAHGYNLHTVALYDELIRVPLVVRGPGLAAGRSDRTVGHVDLAPTLLDLVGVAAPSGFTGSPWPVTDGVLQPLEDRTVLGETRRYADLRSLVKGRWKVIDDRRAGVTEVYDIPADPDETRDRAGRAPAADPLVKALAEAYAAPEEAPTVRKMGEEEREVLQALGYLEPD